MRFSHANGQVIEALLLVAVDGSLGLLGDFYAVGTVDLLCDCFNLFLNRLLDVIQEPYKTAF